MIDSSTELYGLFGDPVSHSRGPLMHSRAFVEAGVNGVYLAFKIRDIKKGIESVRELGIRGVSITIPFKESVIPLLDEVDGLARQVGAVNTIINKNNRLYGYNTDCRGAVEPLKKLCKIKDKKICILGAGGAAKAVAVGMKNEEGRIIIANRSEKRGRALAGQVKGEFVSLVDVNKLSPDIIINTTSLGMTPDIDQAPVERDFFKKNMIVMDIVYNPLKTRMLKDAESQGCTIIDGLSMFINQGAAQFELFTGLKAPFDLMRKTVLASFI
ncbi:MAG: shikimate dehydrogenase [Thermodesulfobacteriota bacterium]|nr:shikimate dehydrogenase [Thermodesulfobacteriota bacterium]